MNTTKVDATSTATVAGVTEDDYSEAALKNAVMAPVATLELRWHHFVHYGCIV